RLRDDLEGAALRGHDEGCSTRPYDEAVAQAFADALVEVLRRDAGDLAPCGSSIGGFRDVHGALGWRDGFAEVGGESPEEVWVVVYRIGGRVVGRGLDEVGGEVVTAGESGDAVDAAGGEVVLRAGNLCRSNGCEQ